LNSYQKLAVDLTFMKTNYSLSHLHVLDPNLRQVNRPTFQMVTLCITSG